MNVYPLFSSVVSATIIDSDTGIDSEYIDNHFTFASTSNFDNENSYASKNINVLDNLPVLKETILANFYNFKNDVMKWHSTDFDFTTSWFTKTTTNGYSQFHYHKNCMYSGILYFDSYDTGNLLIQKNYTDSFKINPPKEYNIYNFETFYIQPKKNLLVFFPSNLNHKVDLYKGINPRYSLAFNLHPIGNIGVGDSSVSIKIN